MAENRKEAALSPAPVGLAADEREFLIKEYESLRREIELHIGDRRKLEIQILFGIAVFYSWLFAQKVFISPALASNIAALPVVIVFLGALRWSALMVAIVNIGTYLKSLEEKLIGNNFGWEHFLKGRRKERRILGNVEGWTGIVFWIVLQGGTILAWILLRR